MKTYTINGKKYKIKQISWCEGCAFFCETIGCQVPEEIELNCGHDSVYKKIEDGE